MFRNPRYLNAQLLRGLAELQGIEIPGERQVTRRTRGETQRETGFRKGLEVSRGGADESELTERYSESFSPVRALNEVVDALFADGALVDLTRDPGAALARFTVLQVEGDLELSPMTEMAALLSAFMPSFMEAAATGEKPEPDMARLAQVVMGRGGVPDFTHVFECESDGQILLVMADPQHLVGGNEPEDLEGDLTILATVDRIVAEGGQLALNRYVMPTMSRTMRRAMGKKGDEGLVGVLKEFAEMMDYEVGDDPLVVDGPVVILEPIAIY